MEISKEVDPIKNITGVRPALLLQPITFDMTSHFSSNGGNALGITDENGPLIRMSLLPDELSQTDSARSAQFVRHVD